MKVGNLAKQIVVVFALTLAAYYVMYSGIERRRVRDGPWQVAFTNDAAGAPAIRIDQPRKAIANVWIVFTNAPPQTNAAAALAFAQPRPVPFAVPYGRCLFMDTTFLPGTLVFELFGHEVQLIPRVLTIDKQERPWRANESILLPASAGRDERTVTNLNLNQDSWEKRR